MPMRALITLRQERCFAGVLCFFFFFLRAPALGHEAYRRITTPLMSLIRALLRHAAIAERLR